MPLILFCGLPAAGKSFLATRLVAYLKEHVQEDVVYITEETVNVNRFEGYKNGHIEKMSRGAIRAAVETALDKKTIVVLDALNYIKGSRYELFCKAKAESTTYCVVRAEPRRSNTPLDLALARNAEQEEQYEPEIIQSIASRFEKPNEKNRWDSPLFQITPAMMQDDQSQTDLLTKITDVIQHGKAMKAGIATQAAPVVETNFIQELERVTLVIVDAVITHQREGNVVDGLRIPSVATTELRLYRNMPSAEARRHRRQFIKISQIRPGSVVSIGDLFVEYLNNHA